MKPIYYLDAFQDNFWHSLNRSRIFILHPTPWVQVKSVRAAGLLPPVIIEVSHRGHDDQNDPTYHNKSKTGEHDHCLQITLLRGGRPHPAAHHAEAAQPFAVTATATSATLGVIASAGTPVGVGGVAAVTGAAAVDQVGPALDERRVEVVLAVLV